PAYGIRPTSIEATKVTGALLALPGAPKADQRRWLRHIRISRAHAAGGNRVGTLVANIAEPFSAGRLVEPHALASAVSIAAPSGSASGKVSIVTPSVATISPPSWLGASFG